MNLLEDTAFETLDGVHIGRACRTLLDKGATIVGSNCYRGPNTMLDVVKEIVKEVPPEKVCGLPVMYRTTEDEPTFYEITDKSYPLNSPVYPRGLDAVQVCTNEVTEFTNQCKDMGLKYMGLCCGNTGNYTRAMALALGRKPDSSKYLNLDAHGIMFPCIKKVVLEDERK
jgi:methionine synthase I (cobalamin-dependent)